MDHCNADTPTVRLSYGEQRQGSAHKTAPHSREPVAHNQHLGDWGGKEKQDNQTDL